MKRGLIGSIILLVIFILGYFLLQKIVITGQATYEVEDPKIYLNLSKTSYAVDEPLKGIVRLEIEDPINAKTKFIAEIDNERITEKNLTSLLDDLGYSYEATEELILPINSATSKTLSFSGSSSKKIGFYLPKSSTVKSINMDISGNAEFPYFDVADDNIIEWQYFGDFTGFKTEKIYPSTLSLTNIGDSLLINTNDTYFCEIIDLPYSKNFRVSAKYKKLLDGGNITAVILSISSSINEQLTAEGGANYCDLPESTNLDWQICDINLSKATKGKNLVCVYTSKGEKDKNYYELSRDNTQSTNRYNCNKPVSGVTSCTQLTSKDYFIAVSGADYSKILSTNIIFPDWFTSYFFNRSLTDYLTNCQEDGVGNCVVPVTIHSDSSGSLTLSNLRIDYKEQGGSSTYTSNFYDVSVSTPAIYILNDVNLTKNETNLTISLDEFNLTAPDISDEFEEFTLNIDLDPGPNDEEDFTVFSTAIPTGISGVEISLNKTKESLTKLKTTTDENVKIITSALNLQSKIDSALTQLNTYKTQIENIKKGNLSTDEKENKTAVISSSLNTLKSELPKDILAKAKVTEISKIEPEDITDEIILESQRNEETKRELYILNADKIDVNTVALAYDLVRFDGKKETSTLIKKSVSGSENEAYIVEIIPKIMASDASKITFITPTEIVEKDPIVKWYYQTLTKEEISYVIPGNVITNLNLIKTIVIPKELLAEQRSVCGNEECEFYTTEEGKKIWLETKETCPEDCAIKIPWLYLIILLVVLVGGIWYINFYRGKFKLRTITEKRLFKSKIDYKNLYNYIKKAQKENFQKEEITNTLLKKGWTKEQIDFIFKKLESKLKKSNNLYK